MYGISLEYPRDDLNIYLAPKNFTFLSKNLLVKPKFDSERYFAVTAPTVWNSLSENMKIIPSVSLFKSRLNIDLFEIAFNILRT